MNATKTPVRFALSVKSACNQTGITQSDIACYLDMRSEAFSRKIRGYVRFNLDEVYDVAQLFGVDAGSMVNGVGDWVSRLDGSAVRRRLEERSHVFSPQYVNPQVGERLAIAAGAVR